MAAVELRIVVDSVALGLAPADGPGPLMGAGRNGHNAADVVFALVCPFQRMHAAHRAAYYGGYSAYPEIV